MTAQPGIFALGTTDHCHLELDAVPGTAARDLVEALAAVPGVLGATAGVNVVVALRPELWEQVRPGHAPADAAGWTEPLVGPDGFTMPATPHDAWVWVAGPDRSTVFDAAQEVAELTAPVAVVATEVTGWVYRRDRDLTGFVDGTENPGPLTAYAAACVTDGPGTGASLVLVQRWAHDSAAWEGLDVDAQERAMGRTKADSVELGEDVMPAEAHVARTKVERDGEEQQIVRRNVAYGGVTDHGTMFVGFSADRWRLHTMLERMAGVPDGVRCALTRYLTPVTGAYYTVPSLADLATFAPDEDD